MSPTMPDLITGDGPCDDCGTSDNIIWSTPSVFWIAVIRPRGEIERDPFLCVPCFVIRVHEAGLRPVGWRLTPEFHWETKTERIARKERAQHRNRRPA